MRVGGTWFVRGLALVAAACFLVTALAIRMFTGDGHGGGRLAQYSGTALYASMVYAGVLFVRPRIAAPAAGLIATAFCWAVEAAQLTGAPAALSARSLLARVVLGVQFDWTDMLWYPVGIVPLVAVDQLLRWRRAQVPLPAGDRGVAAPLGIASRRR